MQRRGFLATTLAAGAAFAALPWLQTLGAETLGAKTPGARPNIVLIMVDDMGYSDIGCFGAEIQTPHIDSLAQRGMRFTHFTNNAKCTPTRTSLLTGNYQGWRGAKTRGTQLIQSLNRAGYRTYMTGKQHGFSAGGTRHSAVMTPGAASFWDLTVTKPDLETSKSVLVVDGKPVPDFLDKHPDFFATDVWTDYAIEFLERDKALTEPLFLYVAHNAPHFPLHAHPKDIEKYRGKYKALGWDRLRTERYRRQQELGIADEAMQLSPRDPSVPAWDSLSDERKDAEDLRMAVYAAMIDRVDQNIGRLLAKITELGQAENTLVLFLSDNGGCSAMHKERGHPGPKGSYTYVGKGWANASNTPFRQYKTWDHEGGIGAPLVACWPAVIAPGSIDRNFAHVVDLTATCLDVAGAANPEILGKPLTPTFRTKPRSLHEQFNWAWYRSKGALRGSWKAVQRDRDPWTLYDLSKDRSELNDLAASEPEVLKTLVDQWKTWADQVQFESRPANLFIPPAVPE